MMLLSAVLWHYSKLSGFLYFYKFQGIFLIVTPSLFLRARPELFPVGCRKMHIRDNVAVSQFAVLDHVFPGLEQVDVPIRNCPCESWTPQVPRARPHMSHIFSLRNYPCVTHAL